MAGNENLIDQVISPDVDTQVSNLNKMLKDLDIQMVKNIQSANQLNAVTGNSRSFRDLSTNATQSAVALERVQQAANRTAISANQLAISNNRVAASNQAAATSAQRVQGEYAKLLAAYNAATLAARNAGVQHGVTSQQFLTEAASVRVLRTQLDAIDQPLGNFQRNVGNYGNIFSRAFGGIRTLANIIPNFGIGTFFLLLGTGIVKLVQSLGLFNSVSTETELRQKALVKAFENADYTKGLESIEKLKTDLDLASKGFVDSSSVVDEYNNTIGKTFGYVDNLNEAQRGFINNSKDYIKVLYLEAAAQINMADAAKYAAEKEKANVELRNDIINVQKGNFQGFLSTIGSMKGSNNPDDVIKKKKDEIIQNEKMEVEYFNNSLKTNERFYTQLAEIKKSHGVKSGGSIDSASDIDTLKNDIANIYLERQKIKDKELIDNNKLSYSKRIQATNDFYNVSKAIAENNYKLETNGIKLSHDQREKIDAEFTNELLSLENDRTNKLKSLRDAAYKQDQEILKNNIQKQKDLQKAVIDDPDQSYPAKLGAIQLYNDRSKELIEANYKEQVKAAGENGKSILLAEQNKAKSILQLDNEVAATRLKIAKENLQKILALSQQSEQEQLETLQNASNLAIRALTKAHDDKEDALTLLRAKGKISEKKYNRELLQLNDQFNIDKLAQDLKTAEAELAIREGNREATIVKMSFNNASTEDVAKYNSTANKGIQTSKNSVATIGNALGRAVSKQKSDNAQTNTGEAEDVRRQIQQRATDATVSAIDSIDKLRQKAYENEIARLEKLSEQIDENANNEKDQVNNSILSNATKARKLAVIDAQTAAHHKAIQAQENKEKTKAARAEKEATIAKIIATGALAVVSALATQPAYLGIILAAITGASVAVELATAIATPLPQFAKGGITPGGKVIWGEAGMESARLPDGSVRFSTGPEITNFPKGTVITPHMELMQQIKPEAFKYAGGEQIGWKELLAQMKKMEAKTARNKFVVNVNTDYEMYKRSYLNR